MIESLSGQLRDAIEAVNVSYVCLDAAARERVALVDDEELEAALRGDDRARGMAAITDWRERQLDAVEEAAR